MKVLLIWPYGAFDGQTMPLCYIYLVPLIRKYYDIERLWADAKIELIEESFILNEK